MPLVPPVAPVSLAAAFLALFVALPAASAADLRVTDSRGVEVVVRAASIDYGGLIGADKESDGIRVYQGDATVTAKWADIQTLSIVGRDDTAAPPRLTLEIVLTGGKKITAGLVRKGRMKLTGTSDLGEYSIDLEKIKSIAPAK